jgi:hypothetical protein
MVGQVVVVSKQVQDRRPGLVSLDAPPHKGMSVCLFFITARRLSEQRAARCIVAPGVHLGRGLPRDVESLHPIGR